MARGLHRLPARNVAAAKPGRHSDGGGLYLVVDKSGARRWAFMFWRDRKPTEIGLGSPIKGVDLPMARERAAECRRLQALGQDPRGWKVPARLAPTFATFAEDVISALEAGWRNDKHKAQWRSTLKAYCGPIADKAVDAISTDDVLTVLRPIWTTKPETASRLRGRIEKVLDAAKAKSFRQGDNPARWRGHLDHLLARQPKLSRGHHAALPWSDVPALIRRLQALGTTSALALEFTILTAARAGETLGATWSEIDLEAKIWTIPGERMKGGREHRVPLTGRACAILAEMKGKSASAYVFPGTKYNRPLAPASMDNVLARLKVFVTVHGFRSSFKDWATEQTMLPSELSEAALAHVTGSQVERAYRRTDALERRRELMAAWEAHAVG
ncbi:site-specific integrase [Hyphomicrobium sp. CS1BSMeth3]|uniref:tyrosine-type recombinase/integrase n=1 Tax=Hyphomicrobium sp. CS1BSMeth3 TaxID=1892844 RepID=UPI0009317D2F|nr:site-specific integrase [Hyphomicrobium sp. CS1BSMeth3]